MAPPSTAGRNATPAFDDCIVLVRPDGQDPAIDPHLAAGWLAHLLGPDGMTPVRVFAQRLGARVVGCRTVRGVVMHGAGCSLLRSTPAAAQQAA